MSVDVLELDRRQVESSPCGVIIGQAVIPGSLDVDRHQVPPRELQGAENVTSQVLDDLMVFFLAKLRRHPHQEPVDIHHFVLAFFDLP